MNTRILTLIIPVSLFAVLAMPAWLAAQEQANDGAAAIAASPVPLINQPLFPDAIRPGGAGFTLTVNGTGFVSGSVVNWNGSARATTFVSSSLLNASILVSDIAKPSTASVTVTNPKPGGGSSNVVLLEVTNPNLLVSMRRSDFAAGTNSISVVTGDFNRDGKLDLAVANFQSDDTVSVLLSNGDGTFRPAVNYHTGSALSSLAVGDFNGDGKLDLAITNVSGVSIFLGNGDGTFQVARNYSDGSGPVGVAVGDFNGDGNLDLAVANINSNNVSILLGNGDGTFQTAKNYDNDGSNPVGVAVGDFNGDGKLDLAVANSLSSNVSIFLGNGDGTFQAAMGYNVGQNPNSAPAVGDFNLDGNLDLAVANTNSNNVSILLGNGDGTFRSAVNFGVGSGPGVVAARDFNGDGKLDLAVANFLDNNVSVILGNGDGTFRSAANFGVGNAPFSVAVGDFNRDGKLDLAVANTNDGGSKADSVSVLLQAPVVSLSTTGLKFADQVIGTSSEGEAITLTVRILPLAVNVIALSGTNPTDFVQTNTCGKGVAADAKCTISVTFKPTQIGPRTAAITITDNATDSPQSVALSGTGVTSGPNATLSPTSIAFTAQLLGTASPAQSVTIINYGNAALSISGFAFTGIDAKDFTQTHTCGGSLATGARCSINVTFRPTASGTRTATLSITDNAAGSPQKVTLRGTGTAAKLSPTSVSFGSVAVGTTSSPQGVTMTNVGTTTLSITGIAITGTNAGDFTQTHTCGSVLATGASCSINVTFKPTASGTRTAALSFTDNGGGSPQTVSLTGTGYFTGCVPEGGQCRPGSHCCPGLACFACGNRACCLPSGSAVSTASSCDDDRKNQSSGWSLSDNIYSGLLN